MSASRRPVNVFDETYVRYMRALMDAEHDTTESRFILDLSLAKPGDRVLDAPCGYGKFARPMVDFGCEYVGVDREPKMITAAREAHGAVDPVSFLVSSVEDLRFESEFDVAVNWFTSFGYEDDAASLRCLETLQRALRPGGRLVMELVHGPRFVEALGDHAATFETFELSVGTMVDRHSVSPDGRYHELSRRYDDDQGSTGEAFFRSRLLDGAEITSWLTRAGFAEVDLFGGTGKPLEPRHHKMIVRATKPAS